MSDDKKPNVFIENMAVLATPEGIQKYVLGTKKDGSSRAVYDVVRDFTKPKKKKKKSKRHGGDASSSTYSFYLDSKKSGKKKKKKSKEKYWHI